MAILNSTHVRTQTFEERDATAITVQWDDCDSWDKRLLKPNEIAAWCEQGTLSTDAVVKILLQQDIVGPRDRNSHSTPSAVPFSEEVLKSVFSSHNEFVAQWRDVAGGCCLCSGKYGFIFQTPADHPTFCSFAIEAYGGQLRGIWLTNSDTYLPQKLLASTPIMQIWGDWSRGMHLAIIPLAFLDTYLQETTADLDEVIKRYQAAERAVTLGYEKLASSQDAAFAALTVELHWCSARVTVIERRWQLGALLTQAVLEFLNTQASTPWSVVPNHSDFLLCTQNLSKRMAARKAELLSLPKKIKNQTMAISTLLLHRDARLTMLITRQNIDIAESSRSTAQATRLDSQSMKTIAILTMVFLPGTFVASLFSSTLFNWSANQGDAIASAYVWVYFVITIPMTGIVLTVWWHWTRLQRKQVSEDFTSRWEKELHLN